MNPKAITCFSAISCLETIVGLSIEPAKETFLLSPCLYGPMFPEGVRSSCGNEVHVKEFDVPPVDAEELIEYRSLGYFGIPVSLHPSFELDVAHCSEFLLGRDQAEPESAQFRRVWSMDRTICPSRRVVYFATLQQIFLNADCPSIKRMIRVRNRTTQVRFPLKSRRFPSTSNVSQGCPCFEYSIGIFIIYGMGSSSLYSKIHSRACLDFCYRCLWLFMWTRLAFSPLVVLVCTYSRKSTMRKW